jgi:hypothetical protein
MSAREFIPERGGLKATREAEWEALAGDLRAVAEAVEEAVA